MCGSETFATEVSSTSMNVASMTEAAITHGLTVGRQGAGGGVADVAIPRPCFIFRAAQLGGARVASSRRADHEVRGRRDQTQYRAGHEHRHIAARRGDTE